MGQIVSSAAKPKRCNISKLSQLGTPAAGEYYLVSSDNSMNAAGQGNFDAYVVGDGHTAAAALELHYITGMDIEDNNDCDLMIADEDGQWLAKFNEGHFQTKQFSSVNAVTTEDNDSDDFVIADENGTAIVRFHNGNIQVQKFNSADFVDILSTKYIDCIGDSLTMGSQATGCYVNTLQSLVAGYNVRNWGVGGETKSTIMVREGVSSIVFANGFTIPSDTSPIALPSMTSRFDGGAVTPLLQGDNTMVNPCFIKGIECIMTYSNGAYYLQRAEAGSRSVDVSANEPLFMNTGKQAFSASISVVWFGTNGMANTESYADELVNAYKIVAKYLPTSKFIFIGLHKFNKTIGEYFENLMFKEFGNKFFNIRDYCCTSMIYDAGITPTSADLSNMANGVCPSSLLYDGLHFKPVSNVCIGTRIFEMMTDLGYFN